MANDDVRRGRALAEMARHLFLWLGENELPGITGFKGVDPKRLSPLFAGIYRQLPPRFPQQDMAAMMKGQGTEDERRLSSLRLHPNYVLLISNREEEVFVGDRWVPSNRILWDDTLPLTDARSLFVPHPLLDSVKMDPVSLGPFDKTDFIFTVRRADLVWDTGDSNSLGLFDYKNLLKYDRPREAFRENVHSALPPEGVAEQTYRSHLYRQATYWNMRKLGQQDEDGDYYPKWRAKRPLAAGDRIFRYSNLTDDYLRQNAFEIRMKEDDYILFLDLGGDVLMYRLLRDPKRKSKATATDLQVDLLYYLGSATAAEKVDRAAKEPKWDGRLRSAVLFYALDGQSSETKLPSRNLAATRPSIRKLIDYRAYLSWYFDQPNYNAGSDKKALARFDRIFFPDECYLIDDIDPALKPIKQDLRDQIFLNELRYIRDQAEEPLHSRWKSLVEWCEEKPNRLVLRKGMQYGSPEDPHILLGVNSSWQVFELNPKTRRITKIGLRDWLDEAWLLSYSDEVYRSTAGMLPFMALVTWGGVAVMTVGILAPGAMTGAMTHLARTAVRKLAIGTTTKLVTHELIIAFRPQLAGLFVEAAVGLVPKTDSIAFEFVRGLIEGFAEGTIEHYFCEMDDRLERQLKKLPAAALAEVTKGASRAYEVFQILNDVAIKVAGVYDSISKIWRPAYGAMLVSSLLRAGQQIVMALIILAFVVVYLDFVARRGRKGQKEFDKWLEEKGRVLKAMADRSGEALAEYVHALKAGDKTADADADFAGKMKEILASCLDDAQVVGELFEEFLAQGKFKSWEELKSLGLVEFMTLGFSAIDAKLREKGGQGLGAEQAKVLGASIGELIGTVLFERRFWKGIKNKRPKGLVQGKHFQKVAKGLLTDGIWRGLWRFILNPIEQNLQDVLPTLKHGASEIDKRFEEVVGSKLVKDTSYSGFLSDLLDGELIFHSHLVALAGNEKLTLKLATLVASARNKDVVPPDLEDILKGDQALWPREAVSFMLLAWTRFALRELRQVFALLHNRDPFEGKFQLSQFFEIMGLDVSVDDETVARLRTNVEELVE